MGDIKRLLALVEAAIAGLLQYAEADIDILAGLSMVVRNGNLLLQGETSMPESEWIESAQQMLGDARTEEDRLISDTSKPPADETAIHILPSEQINLAIAS